MKNIIEHFESLNEEDKIKFLNSDIIVKRKFINNKFEYDFSNLVELFDYFNGKHSCDEYKKILAATLLVNIWAYEKYIVNYKPENLANGI